MTWSRSGHFTGSYTDKDEGYYGAKQILRRLGKRKTGALSDILVVEKNGWDTKKTKTYLEANKIVIPAEDVFSYFQEHFPEYLL